jgi:hypothetical protein
MWPEHKDIDTCLANTHPLFSDRIARIETIARGYPHATARPDSEIFSRLVKLVKA